MERPLVAFHSHGPSGNIYYVMALVRDALRKQHRITDYNNLWEVVQNSESYTKALAEIRKVVDLIDLDGQY